MDERMYLLSCCSCLSLRDPGTSVVAVCYTMVAEDVESCSSILVSCNIQFSIFKEKCLIAA